MSIASQVDGKISIIYKVFGDGTKIISNWKEGDRVDVIGPLGNYWKDYRKELPILIGGGVGIAPILNLHHKLIQESIEHYLIMGARDKKEHFISHNPENNIFLATDNDSYGIKGNVIVALKEILYHLKNQKSKIFTCGPPGMMLSVANFARDEGINCDLALETIMACGVGICQGCTVSKNVKNNKNTYREKYALACIDGPIFNIKEIDNASFIH